MTDDNNKKRRWPDHGAKRRRHDRNKFRRITNSNPQKKDLTAGLSGILISCTPRHERDAFRDAVLLFGRFLDDATGNPTLSTACAATTVPGPVTTAAAATASDPAPALPQEGNSVPETVPNSKASGDSDSAIKVQVKENEPSSGKEQNHQDAAELLPHRECSTESHGNDTSTLDEVDVELRELRNPQLRPFSQIDGGLHGAVFMRVHVPGVDLEKLVEVALREARASGASGARRCFRIIPVHTTCYAKLEDVTQAAISVVQKHFPPAILYDDGSADAGDKSGDDDTKKKTTYAIIFRSRSNSGAHRDQYIPAIASAIEKEEPRYKVNLTNPDVTLLVEIVKTICYIGTFRHYYQLARMNLQEAACPSKPNTSKSANALTKDNNNKDLDDAGSSKATINIPSKDNDIKDLDDVGSSKAKVSEDIGNGVVVNSRNETTDNVQTSEKTDIENSTKNQEGGSAVADTLVETTPAETVVEGG